MLKSLKQIAKYVFMKSGYELQYTSPIRPSGLNLARDLRLIINSTLPVCFDVGANRGQTIDLFLHIFKQPRIYSFEPSKEMFYVLEKKRSSQISLYNIALGDNHGLKTFTNYTDGCLSSFLSLTNDAENEFKDVTKKSTQDIEVQTLDDFFRKENINHIDLLKIDTQGYDLQVLRGANNYLSSGAIGAVLVELNFVNLYIGQSRPDEITQYLIAHKYKLIDYYDKVRNGLFLASCNALFVRVRS